MKKIIYILLTVFLSLFTLCACTTPSVGAGTAAGVVGHYYSINFSEKTLVVGESAQIIATYGESELSYSSSDETIVTVSQTGLITAVGKGVAYIAVSSSDTEEKLYCEITVEQPVYTITFEETETYEVYVGANKKLRVILLRDGVAYTDTVNWSVNGGATLSVDGTEAMFMANTAGNYTVTVTSGAGAVNTLAITVIDQTALA